MGRSSKSLSAFGDVAAYMRWKPKKYNEASLGHETMKCSLYAGYVALVWQGPFYSGRDEENDGSTKKRRLDGAASIYFVRKPSTYR